MDWQEIEKKSKGKQFRKATDELDRGKVREATGRTKAQKGRRQYPLTTRIPDDRAEVILDEIKRWADELHMTQNDVQAWCLLHGLQALENGERPETEERPRAKPVLPEIG